MFGLPPPYTRPIWAEISTAKLAGNFRAADAVTRQQLGPRATLLAVIKAGAYGHGACECAQTLADAGASWLGVTSVQEGVAVRRSLGSHKTTPRILIMCGIWPGDTEKIVKHQLTPVVWEPCHLEFLDAHARESRLPPQSIAVHLEIDTGMARQGITPGNLLHTLLQRFTPDSPIFLEGVMTHLASAECITSEHNVQQMVRFTQAIHQITEARLPIKWIHAGNTSAIDSDHALDTLVTTANSIGASVMTRAGLALYGYALPLVPSGTHAALRPLLHPVLHWKTRIMSIRTVDAGDPIGYSSSFIAPSPMRVALLPVGYADGLRRELSSTNTKNGGSVLIHGRRAAILGRISMDLTVVDISQIPQAGIGDEAVLIGQQNDAFISAEEHATLCNTIVYEILCGIGDRVPRIVVA